MLKGEIWWAVLPKSFLERIDQSLKTVFDILGFIKTILIFKFYSKNES